MMQHHKYSLTEIENMMPWEREIYIGLLEKHIKEENERKEKEHAEMKARQRKYLLMLELIGKQEQKDTNN